MKNPLIPSSFTVRLANYAMILTAFCLIALACTEDDDSVKPGQDEGIRTDSQLVISKYILPAGKTEEFSSGFEIVADEGIDIQGDIIIRPEREGDFTIRCLNGDISITGKIIVRDDSAAASGRKATSSRMMSNKETAQRGTPLFFILDRPGAVISIGRGAQIQSGNGRDAQEELIVISQGRYVGGVGAPGGDIIIRAHGGKIILANPEPGDAPLFILGNGGKGANVRVDRQNFQTSGPNLELVGGRGGDSGILFLEAETIEGIPSVEELNIEAELLAGGLGGRGGDVFWYPAEGKTYPLQEIIFRGGNGGNGAVQGGRGGLTIYWSLTPINETGDPVASVSVTGGNGGKVFPSPIPIALAQGGDGGEAMVIGNDGWTGMPPDSGGPIDGANGGDVIARGGNGGDVLEGVLFQSAIGGNGAMDEISLTLSRLVQELGIELLFQTWVISGSGGDGASGCDGCPGGDGGNSGDIQAYGGDGGNVPNRIGARGGRGGDVWQVKRGLFGSGMGKGGNGNPAGEGGCPGTIAVVPGIGGSGYLSGEDGTLVGEIPDDDCDPDGMICGEGLTCENDTSIVDRCWTKLGSTFTAFYETSRKTTHPVTNVWSEIKISISETGTLAEITGEYNDRFTWNIEGTRVTQIRTSDGKGDRDTTEYYTDYINNNRVGSPAGEARTPRCINGELYLPFRSASANYTIEGTDVNGYLFEETRHLQFGGCNPFLVTSSRPDPGNWRCCDSDQDGYDSATYGDCPP